jgi:hypothetical protein
MPVILLGIWMYMYTGTFASQMIGLLSFYCMMWGHTDMEEPSICICRFQQSPTHIHNMKAWGVSKTN